jgi:hypothetical protein
MKREKAQAGNLQVDYPEVNRGGSSCSSVETPVMGVVRKDSGLVSESKGLDQLGFMVYTTEKKSRND